MLRFSRVYASPAVGRPGQPVFLNAAALLETDLPPQEVRRRLRDLEAGLGRVRTSDREAPRTIDLDLVLYDDLVLDQPPLRLPDPDLRTRAYLAVTVSELDPDVRHPETGEPLADLAARLRRGSPLARRDDVRLVASEPYRERDGRTSSSP